MKGTDAAGTTCTWLVEVYVRTIVYPVPGTLPREQTYLTRQGFHCRTKKERGRKDKWWEAGRVMLEQCLKKLNVRLVQPNHSFLLN